MAPVVGVVPPPELHAASPSAATAATAVIARDFLVFIRSVLLVETLTDKPATARSG